MNDPLAKVTFGYTTADEPIAADQTKSAEGGYVFAVDNWTKLYRFLIIGTEGGSFYMNENNQTINAVESLIAAMAEDGPRVVQMVYYVSINNLAPKVNQCLFALAVCLNATLPDGTPDSETRAAASNYFNEIVRTQSHLAQFVMYWKNIHGSTMGRRVRKAIAGFYNEMTSQKALYQLTKYGTRNGWSGKDILRVAHPRPDTDELDSIFQFIKTGEAPRFEDLAQYANAVETAKHSTDVNEVGKLIAAHKLPWEAVNPELMGNAGIWPHLAGVMPYNACVRMLNRMTAAGYLSPLSGETKAMCDYITHSETISKSRIHPMSLLIAMYTYRMGHGVKGKLAWTPVNQISDALEEAFYLSFGNVEPSNKNIMISLDVSPSMDMAAHELMGVRRFTPRVVSAVMCMVLARTERNHVITAFSDQMVPIDVSAKDSLSDVINKVNRLRFGGTDCSAPMRWALEQKIHADGIIIYTDSETGWYGAAHPSEVLKDYRRRLQIDTRMVVHSMVTNDVTIADPSDAGMLDIVGFDASAPKLTTQFVAGKI